MDFVQRWSEATEIGAVHFVGWLGVSTSKFYDWRERYGRVNEHNAWVPRDFWLENWCGDRRQSNLWQVSTLNPFGGRSAEEVTGHGTQKRVELMRRRKARPSTAIEARIDSSEPNWNGPAHS